MEKWDVAIKGNVDFMLKQVNSPEANYSDSEKEEVYKDLIDLGNWMLEQAGAK